MAKGLAGTIDALFGIDGLVDDVKNAGIVGLAVAGGIAVDQMLISPMTPWLKDQRGAVKGAVDIVLGAAAGIGLAKLGGSNPSSWFKGVGAGFGGALVGLGLLKIGGDFLGGTIPFPALASYDSPPDFGPSLADFQVAEQMTTPGFAGIQVSDRSMIPNAVDGFGLQIETQQAPLAGIHF